MSFGIFMKAEIPELSGEPIIYEGPDAANKVYDTTQRI